MISRLRPDSIPTVGSATEAADVMRGIRESGMMPLFHGTRHMFEKFEYDAERTKGFANCDVGVHVTSDPFLALDYAGDDGHVLILSVPKGRFGTIDNLEAYIDMDFDTISAFFSPDDGLMGLVADDLGDDLNGAGIIFDPSLVTIVSRIPASLVWKDLLREREHGDSVLMSAAHKGSGPWPGAEFVPIDTHEYEDPEPA